MLSIRRGRSFHEKLTFYKRAGFLNREQREQPLEKVSILL